MARRFSARLGWRLSIAATLVAVSVAVAPSATAYIGYGHDHDGWVKWTIWEQFDVKSSEIYNRFGYYQDTWSVQNPIWRTGYCWNSSFPGWNNVACGSWYDNASPARVGMVVYGEFHWYDRSIDYQQNGYWYAESNNTWNYTCYFAHGGYPHLWTGECTGGRWG